MNLDDGSEARIYALRDHPDARLADRRSPALFAGALIAVVAAAAVLRIPHLTTDSIWASESQHAWNAAEVWHSIRHLISREVTESSSQLYVVAAAPLTTFLENHAAVRWTTMFFSIAGIAAMYVLGVEATRNRLHALIGALILGAHPFYFFLSTRGLPDVPLVAAYCIVTYAVLRAERDGGRWWLATGAGAGLSLFLRGSGLMLIGILGAYLLIRGGGIVRSQPRRGILNLAAAFSAAAIPYVIVNLAALGEPVAGATANFQLAADYGAYLRTVPRYVTWFLTPFAVLGAISGCLSRHRASILMTVWILVDLAFFTLLVRNTMARQLLPVVPPAIILALEGFEMVASRTLHRLTRPAIGHVIMIAWFAALAAAFQLQAGRYTTERSRTFTGMTEISAWLETHAPPGATVYAQSRTVLRALSGRDLAENGGSLYQLPDTKQAFERLVATGDSTFVQLDIWEREAPAYVQPLTRERLSYFVEHGFELARVVERPLPTTEGMTTSAVAFVLRRVR